MSETPPRLSRRRRLLAIPILVILFPVVYSLLGGVVPRGADAVHASLQMPDPKHESCVRETLYQGTFNEQLRKIQVKRGSSSGLGLDIARRTATRGGGSLSVGRSKLGGTEVVLHLPVIERPQK